ncbi:MAG: hypothetical protein ACE5R4_18115 [Armatimonadota bacterium]
MKRIKLQRAIEVLRQEVQAAAEGGGVLRLGAGRLRLRAQVSVSEEGAFVVEEATGHEVDIELEVYPSDE